MTSPICYLVLIPSYSFVGSRLQRLCIFSSTLIGWASLPRRSMNRSMLDEKDFSYIRDQEEKNPLFIICLLLLFFTSTSMPSAKTSSPKPKGAGKANRQNPGPACQQCRLRKFRCDRQRPCAGCVDSGLKCVFDPTPPQRGPRKGHLKILRSRIGTETTPT